jgi:hypothetical protein
MVTATRKSKPLPEVTARGASSASAASKPGKEKPKQGHAKPLPLPHELNDLRRLRVGHVMSLLSISHATLYARLQTGTIPPPDGRDGRRPFWKVSTIKTLLGA